MDLEFRVAGKGLAAVTSIAPDPGMGQTDYCTMGDRRRIALDLDPTLSIPVRRSEQRRPERPARGLC